MNIEVDKYINKRYNRWLDYAIFHCTQAGMLEDAVDLLNEVMISLLKKDESFIFELYNKKKNDGYRELDFYILRMIKLNAQSDTAPYRARYKSMPIDNDVDYSRLNIEDKVDNGIDISGRYLKRFNQINEIVDRLDLSKFEKDVFNCVFIEGENLSKNELVKNIKSAYIISQYIKLSISFILFFNGIIPNQPCLPKTFSRNKRFYQLLESYFIANEDVLQIINTKQLI